GLYVYPNLMAADILAYKATHVPVGEDQKQHLELARNIAQKFNHDYGVEFFPVIDPLILGAATRVMSLRDGSRKMSKSDPSEMTRITMTDDAEAIARKIKKATTDAELLPGPEMLAEDGSLPEEVRKARPEVFNLLGIYAALSDESWAQTLTRFDGQGFGAFKPALAELAVEKLSSIGDEMNRLMADPGHVDSVLRAGAEKARARAEPILREVQDIVGFLRP
ncbi:MAG: tryptophan--tRNA ligase, partial [Rhodovibrionaceae bacterium]